MDGFSDYLAANVLASASSFLVAYQGYLGVLFGVFLTMGVVGLLVRARSM